MSAGAADFHVANLEERGMVPDRPSVMDTCRCTIFPVVPLFPFLLIAEGSNNEKSGIWLRIRADRGRPHVQPAIEQLHRVSSEEYFRIRKFTQPSWIITDVQGLNASVV
jgi:hypothetical protein